MKRAKVQLHVEKTAQEMGRRFVEAWHRAEHGKRVSERHVSFETWNGMAGVLTTKRVELLRHLHSSREASVAALARALDRDYKRVHADVEALEAAGLIDRDATGLRTDYDEIRTTVSLA
jgi:predicted transcriptional regulator